jgi:hypothetical protein
MLFLPLSACSLALPFDELDRGSSSASSGNGSGGGNGGAGGGGGAPKGFPHTEVLDTFDRADGPLGSKWLVDDADFAIESETLDAHGETMALWKDPFGADQEAFVTFAHVDPDASELNLVLKSQDPNGCEHVEVRYEPQTGLFYVRSCYGDGHSVAHGPILNNISVRDGDRLGARATKDGSVKVFKNGELVDTWSVSTWKHFASGGRIGVRMVLGVDPEQRSITWDDFGGGSVTE